MSLDVAYSIEAKDFLDPDRAYDLYWAGIIKDKKKFICPGSDCNAQVTCANLDEDLQDMKVVPHFRIYGEHSQNCEILNKKPLKSQYEDDLPIKSEKRSIDESVVDVFELSRPESYYDTTDLIGTPNSPLIKKPKFSAHNNQTTLKETGSIGKVYSVRSVVSRYIRYKKDGTLENRRVNIAGKDIPYRSIFKCIWEQELDNLPDHPVIYYGWAYINRFKANNGYQIKFKKTLKNGVDELTTTIMISDKLINSYKIKKLVTTRLQKINKQQKPTAFIYIYAKPEIKESATGKKYANFAINNLDMIDINYSCPIPTEI